MNCVNFAAKGIALRTCCAVWPQKSRRSERSWSGALTMLRLRRKLSSVSAKLSLFYKPPCPKRCSLSHWGVIQATVCYGFPCMEGGFQSMCALCVFACSVVHVPIHLWFLNLSSLLHFVAQTVSVDIVHMDLWKKNERGTAETGISILSRLLLQPCSSL